MALYNMAASSPCFKFKPNILFELPLTNMDAAAVLLKLNLTLGLNWRFIIWLQTCKCDT